MKSTTDHYDKSEELAPWRTFSIFISSTFADMQAERDYLKQIVIPLVWEEIKNEGLIRLY